MNLTQHIILLLGLTTSTAYAVDSTIAKKYYAPANFETILATAYSPTLSLTSTLTNRGRYLISSSATVSPKAGYLTIGAKYNANTGFDAKATIIPTNSTYKTIFSKLIQLVANSTDTSGFYRLDSHLHPNDSIDVDEANNNTLKFRNNLGKAAQPYGYVTFSYDSTTHLLKAEKRYIYTYTLNSSTDAKGRVTTSYPATYTEDSAFQSAGFYVAIKASNYSLVANAALATPLYFYTSADSYDIPTRMNPTGTAYISNPPAPFLSNMTTTSVEAGSTAFYNSINATYRTQVSVAGKSAVTKTAALKQLLSIPTALTTQNTKMRYAPALYNAFRDSALSKTLISDAPADGTPGQHLVPYIYFTNEKDSAGSYHPFMNIVTYTNHSFPHGLLDIPGPPYSGAGSPTTPVTRYANLGFFIARIPLKDYGQVATVTDNAMKPDSRGWAKNLITDSGCPSTQVPSCPFSDNYNYTSTADIGVLIDGSIIFPVLNNTLMPAQWKGELSLYGCHVGQGGGGPHCHADAFKTGQKIVTLYNDNDYLNKDHPPLIGFGYDGVALFGTYRSDKDAQMLGYQTELDAFGGHDHDAIGYHYHAHTATMPTTYSNFRGGNGIAIDPTNTPVNVLMKGAWAGNINAVPFFGDGSDFKNNPYLGGM